jgi:ribosome-binding protein aMBF1 (putative translation factor)
MPADLVQDISAVIEMFRRTSATRGIIWKQSGRHATVTGGPGALRECVPLGQLVRERRQARGMSQLQLAATAGVDIGVVRDLEQGVTSRPRTAFVRRLITVLGT